METICPILRLGPFDDSFLSISWPENLKIHSYLDLYKAIPVENPLFVFFWAACFFAVLFLLNRRLEETGALKIQFYITDIWAGILCLIPCYKLVPWLLVSDDGIVARTSGLLTLVALSISAGIWSGLQLSAPLEGAPLPGRVSHAISVLGGGLMGWLGLFLSGMVFGFLLGLIRAFLPDSCFTVPAPGNIYNYERLFSRIPIDDPFFSVYAAACLIFITTALRQRIMGSRRFKIRFFITDFWAVALSLVPAYGLLPFALSASGIEDARTLSLFFLVALCIACGCWAALLWLSTPAEENALPVGRMRRMFIILCCGLLGFLGLFAAASFYPIESAIHSFIHILFTIIYYFPLLGFMGLVVAYLLKKALSP